MLTDPVADMLTRIRNANRVGHDKTDIPGSRLKLGIARVLKEEGFIKDYEWVNDGRQGVIRVYLKYGGRKERVINGLKRVSRPGRRVYVKADEVPRVMGGLGVAIVSTSQGLMTDKKARRSGLGGEVLCYVW